MQWDAAGTLGRSQHVRSWVVTGHYGPEMSTRVAAYGLRATMERSARSIGSRASSVPTTTTTALRAATSAKARSACYRFRSAPRCNE